MAGTLAVLALLLISRLLLPLLALVVTSLLARHSGQHLKSMSWSSVHGYTAEFFEPEEPRADTHK